MNVSILEMAFDLSPITRGCYMSVQCNNGEKILKSKIGRTEFLNFISVVELSKHQKR